VDIAVVGSVVAVVGKYFGAFRPNLLVRRQTMSRNGGHDDSDSHVFKKYVDSETFSQKLKRKLWNEPFVPIGCLVTTYFLVYVTIICS
jgi:hypothetical protein